MDNEKTTPETFTIIESFDLKHFIKQVNELKNQGWVVTGTHMPIVRNKLQYTAVMEFVENVTHDLMVARLSNQESPELHHIADDYNPQPGLYNVGVHELGQYGSN